MKVRFEHHGSIWLVHPNDQETREYLEQRVQSDAQWWDGALVVEARYVDALAQGLAADGLEVEGF